MLDKVSGEIGKHLGGTAIAPVGADGEWLVPDYPILPTRRRFWEHVLRAVDRGGTQGQLRTQLRVSQEAARKVGELPIGNVVGGDLIYDQQSSGMLQSGVLSREIHETIVGLRQQAGTGELKSRIAALIFMIDQLREVGNDLGLRADSKTVADLLVTDLTSPSSGFRNEVATVLKELHGDAKLTLVEGAYALQTKESQEWTADMNARFNSLKEDSAKIAAAREEMVRGAVEHALAGASLVQGRSKTPRKLAVAYGQAPPVSDGTSVPVWVRCLWDVSEKAARDEAAALGSDSPVVHVLLPKIDADALREALARMMAATQTAESRPMPATDDGRKARASITAEAEGQESKARAVIGQMLRQAKVNLSAGADMSAPELRSAVLSAAEGALVRLFSRFDQGDSTGWPTVSKRVLDGSGDALSAVGHQGEPDKHPVCKAVREAIAPSGTKGLDVRQRFTGVGFGWPQDAVDAALLVLLQAGLIRAESNGAPVSIKSINLTQVGKLVYRAETKVVTTMQRIDIRGLFPPAGVPAKAGEEQVGVAAYLQKLLDLAKVAGGDPPLPEPPDTAFIHGLQQLSGNDQLLKFWEEREELKDALDSWMRAEKLVSSRKPRWEKLERLQLHAAQLPIANEVARQVEALRAERGLLTDPDPVTPLIKDLVESLRMALAAAIEKFTHERERGHTALSKDESFASLSNERATEIVQECGLGPVQMPEISTEADLLAALDSTPLSYWPDRTAGLSARYDHAREIAVAETSIAPTVTYRPPQATLRDQGEVDGYVERLRQDLMREVNGGKTVVI